MELKNAGYNASELKEAGFSSQDILDVKFITGLKDAGLSLTELISAGFNANELRYAGFDPDELKKAGCDLVLIQEQINTDTSSGRLFFTLCASFTLCELTCCASRRIEWMPGSGWRLFAAKKQSKNRGKQREIKMLRRNRSQKRARVLDAGIVSIAV